MNALLLLFAEALFEDKQGSTYFCKRGSSRSLGKIVRRIEHGLGLSTAFEIFSVKCKLNMHIKI